MTVDRPLRRKQEKTSKPIDTTLNGLFPTPLYSTKRDMNTSSLENNDIEDIIKEGMNKNQGNSSSTNNYIFNEKLKKIKQFCEQQIKIYVEEVISPKEDLDFYITQSWLNVNEPGRQHHPHMHPNSAISGVYYVEAEKDDIIKFKSPLQSYLHPCYLHILPETYNIWNSANWDVPIQKYDLILFPSWLEHMVPPNDKATTDRISISFNTFVKSTLGRRKDLTELILK
jgi:uncharacterized protein (TIGR02466 family)